MFIVIEGLDGAGKSTQVEFIKQHLKENYPNKEIIFTREPGGYENYLGEQLRSVILNNEMDDYTRALLYAASRYEHQLKIKKWLEEGKIVICDRYIYSSIAYNANNLSEMNEILSINRYNDIVKPDYILFYRIDIDTYKHRKYIRSQERELDALERKSDDFFIRTIDYYTLALEEEYSKVKEIDATKSIEEVKENTIKIINEIIKEEF